MVEKQVQLHRDRIRIEPKPLGSGARKLLEKTTLEARAVAEAAARAALEAQAVPAAEPFRHMGEAERALRNRLRAHGRALGDERDRATGRQAMVFVRRNQKVSAIKAPARVETPQFSERAVFEAVVNAVAHRDYSIHAPEIRLFIFDDRFELYSPGAPPNTVTVENMPLRQATRNELVTRLLSECPVADSAGNDHRAYFMEKRGEGVPIILDESEKLSGKKPIYRLIDDTELLLTIFAAGPQSSRLETQPADPGS